MAKVQLSSARKSKAKAPAPAPDAKPAAAPKVSGNGKPDFFVKDLSLAEWGRKSIEIAEHEMPGLMAIRRKHGDRKSVV